MFDNPQLPLALIMEEFLEGEKKEDKSSDEEDTKEANQKHF